MELKTFQMELANSSDHLGIQCWKWEKIWPELWIDTFLSTNTKDRMFDLSLELIETIHFPSKAIQYVANVWLIRYILS